MAFDGRVQGFSGGSGVTPATAPLCENLAAHIAQLPNQRRPAKWSTGFSFRLDERPAVGQLDVAAVKDLVENGRNYRKRPSCYARSKRRASSGDCSICPIGVVS